MVNTINPDECDRTTVYTGECRNFQDTEWITFDSGRRRAPDGPDYQWLVDSGTVSFWTRDDQVRNLVRLVPADRVEDAGADRDRWRRAHAIVEAERDQARRERDEWEEKYLDTDEALHRTRRERDEAVTRAARR